MDCHGEGIGGVEDLAGNRLSVRMTLVVALIAPLALAACGRKGPLDPPPSAATPPPPTTPVPAPTGFIDPTTPTGEAQPAPVRTTQAAPPPPPQATPPGTSHPLWNSFLLDPLIR
jgi:predicted small lipoprotein YifL